MQTHQNHKLENISTKTYYFFTAPPLTHQPYSRSNVQSLFLSLCVKFVRRPEPPLPSASCHRQPSLLCMQASSTITGNTCICFLRPGNQWRGLLEAHLQEQRLLSRQEAMPCCGRNSNSGSFALHYFLYQLTYTTFVIV